MSNLLLIVSIRSTEGLNQSEIKRAELMFLFILHLPIYLISRVTLREPFILSSYGCQNGDVS